MVSSLKMVKELYPEALVGISSGIFKKYYGKDPSNWLEGFLLNERPLEVSVLQDTEFSQLAAYLSICDAQINSENSMVSLHLPSKGNFSDQKNVEYIEQIGHLFHHYILHPDIVKDFDMYLPHANKILLENMDLRKHTGKTIAEMQLLLTKLPGARICFDVAHTWTHDASMQFAHEFYDELGHMVQEVHLSGIGMDGHHINLTKTQLEAYTPILDRLTHIPWIIESL